MNDLLDRIDAMSAQTGFTMLFAAVVLLSACALMAGFHGRTGAVAMASAIGLSAFLAVNAWMAGGPGLYGDGIRVACPGALEEIASGLVEWMSRDTSRLVALHCGEREFRAAVGAPESRVAVAGRHEGRWR